MKYSSEVYFKMYESLFNIRIDNVDVVNKFFNNHLVVESVKYSSRLSLDVLSYKYISYLYLRSED